MTESKKVKLLKDLKGDGYKIVKHDKLSTILKKDNVTIKLK